MDTTLNDLVLQINQAKRDYEKWKRLRDLRKMRELTSQLKNFIATLGGEDPPKAG
jgi:hypothetical protein